MRSKKKLTHILATRELNITVKIVEGITGIFLMMAQNQQENDTATMACV
jgi:hypothetical protein